MERLHTTPLWREIATRRDQDGRLEVRATVQKNPRRCVDLRELLRPLTGPDAATLQTPSHRTARYGLDAWREDQYDAFK